MISNFKKQYDSRYQDILHKALVGRMIASHRLKANLQHGESVTRFKLDVSKVKVRTITPLVDRTIDPVTNSTQLLQITEYKGTTFPVSQWERTLSGNPNLGTMIGKEVAIKVATYLDADILSEVRNANQILDAGDLGGSAGTPYTMTVNGVPAFATTAQAKLNAGGARTGKKAFVVDDYALAVINQSIIGRDTELGDNFLQNGFSGKLVKAEVFVSDNLTGEAVIDLSSNPSDGDEFTIGGVTFTIKATPAAAGDVDLGGSGAATAANLAAAINAGAGEGSAYIELSADDRGTIDELRLTATVDGTDMTVVGIGSGRLAISGDLTTSKNFIHGFYGVIGAIDVVVQKEVNMFMTREPRQDTKNVFNDIIYGIKTFDDGAKKMLDVHIAA